MADEEDKKEDGAGDEKDEAEQDPFDEIYRTEIDGGDEHAEDEAGKDEKTDEKGEEKKDEKKDPTLADVMTRLEKAEAKNTELEKAARRAFYGERQEKKAAKGKEEEVTLTDAEIKAIIKDNKDDPEVLFNALVYKQQQMMKTGTKAAVDEVEIKNKNEQLSSFVRNIVPDIDEEGSKSNEAVTKVQHDMGLEDHPHGKFLAWAAAVALHLPDVKKDAFEAGKKASLDDKADNNRKDDIRNGHLGPGGKRESGNIKGSGGELSASQMETAKMMGFDKNPQKMKLYRDQILRGSNRKAA